MYELTRMFGEDTLGNLWDNAEVAYNDTSSELDIGSFANISIMVNIYSDEANTSTAQATINFEASPDGENWTYCSQISDNLPQGSSSEAHIFETVGAQYIRLTRDDSDTDSDVYITATLQAKH